MDRIARVFPRRTNATPQDELAFVGEPPGLYEPEFDRIHVSAAFTYDIPEAERLATAWGCYGLPVEVGGPAYGEPEGDFVPGRYLRTGYVITSRGCPKRCWFCSAWKRNGDAKELPITEGWILQDDNLLACSKKHICDVFDMLARQPQRPVLSGGLEPGFLQQWHVDLIRVVKAKRVFCAYDTSDDLEPLMAAGRMLNAAGLNARNRRAAAYVLIGYPGDTFEQAERRLEQTVMAGFMPFAMLYSDDDGNTAQGWNKFRREWCRPEIIAYKIAEILG